MENFVTTGEQIEPIEATVKGTIPEWLDGQFLSNGPGVFDLESGFTVNNFIDGYSVLYKFSIRNRQVFFSKRHLQSESIESARRVGKPVVAEFGTRAYSDPKKGIFENVINNLFPDITDNCNAGIVVVAGNLFATHDISKLTVVQVDDLSVGEKVDLFKFLGVHLSCINSLKHKFSSDMFTVMTTILPRKEYSVVKISDNCSSGVEAIKNSQIIATIKSRWSYSVSYLRSFAQTDDYVVLIEQPCTLSALDIGANRISGKSFKDCLRWCPNLMNLFYVIDKVSGAVTSTVYESEKAFFFFHDINAYTLDKEIIVDLICYDDTTILESHSIKNLRGDRVPPQAQARRFILPIISNIKDVPEGVNLVKSNKHCKAVRHGDVIRVDYQVLYDSYHELPTVNPKHFGKKYKYYYATSNLFKVQFEFSVLKVDVEKCEVKTWFAGDGQIPSEPVFLENPDSSNEDDGVLLVGISSLTGDTNRLVILNASSMELIASASVQCHIPASLCCLFYSS